MGVKRHPWSRRSAETHKAFAAFVAYRDIGSDRSIRKALIVAGKTPEKPWWFEEWSARHGWPSRAAAYDAHLDAIKVKAIEAEHEQDVIDQHKATRLMLRIAIEGMEVGGLEGKDAVRAGDTAIKLMRLLRGESTEHTETSEGMSIERFRELDREASAKLAAIEKGREPTTEGE